jgi:hypothetical protein
MYGWATSMPQCTGIGLRWTWDEDTGKLRSHQFYDHARQELEWLSWYAHTNNVYVKHRWNSGKAINVHGKFPDGYIPSERTCLFFDGCYWHGHKCSLTKQLDKPEDFWQRSQRDFAIREYLKRRGYKIVTMRECDWGGELLLNSEAQAFVDKHFTLPLHPYMDLQGFEDEILADRFFGMVRCSIGVPDGLKDKFKDLPPIFKNALVGKADIGEHMRAFCEAHELLTEPRRCLISSYGSNDIMIGTPLLKWYLQHNLTLDHVYEAFEFKPKACFANFIKRATNIRRQADRDPAVYGILGAMEKLKVNW